MLLYKKKNCMNGFLCSVVVSERLKMGKSLAINY